MKDVLSIKYDINYKSSVDQVKRERVRLLVIHGRFVSGKFQLRTPFKLSQ